MKVVGYVRVSTDEQAEEGVSLDAQSSRIKAYCTLHGHELLTTFSDAGLSGKSMIARPGLIKALDAVCREKAILVVYSLSRMSRSVRDTIDIADRLRESGAELASLTENLDTTTATGRLVFKFFALLAEFERDMGSERTSTALRHKRAAGERVGRYPQFGYYLDSTGTMCEHKEEQRVLSVIDAMVDKSDDELREHLTFCGYKFRGRLFRTRDVKKIRKSLKDQQHVR